MNPALFVVLVRFVTLVLTSYLTPSLLALNHLLESLIILIVPHLTLFTALNVLAVIFCILVKLAAVLVIVSVIIFMMFARTI